MTSSVTVGLYGHEHPIKEPRRLRDAADRLGAGPRNADLRHRAGAWHRRTRPAHTVADDDQPRRLTAPDAGGLRPARRRLVLHVWTGDPQVTQHRRRPTLRGQRRDASV